MLIVDSCQPRWFALCWVLALALPAITPFANAQEPTLALPDVDGRSIRLTDFRGRWVAINFWATWCTPCLLEMPELQAFYDANRDRVVVIGVNFEDLDSAKVRQFAKDLAVTFPIVMSGGQPVPGFALKGLPTTFLVSPTGQLVDTHLGTVNAAMLNERIAELEKNDNLSR